MSRDENKAVVGRFWEEVWNRRELDVLDEIYTDDFVLHAMWYNPSLGRSGEEPGAARAKGVIGNWFTGFPDLRVSVDDVIAEDDKVGTRHAARATHTGDFMGIPATGKEAVVTGMTIHRLADGLIAEAWTCWDALGMMRQLGIAPGGPGREPSDEHLARAARASAASDGTGGKANPEVEARNKAILERFWTEVWDGDQLDVVDEIFHEDFVDHGLAPGLTQEGPEGAKEAVVQFRRGVPDLHLKVLDMVAEGDKVLSLWESGGTQTGPIGNIPPTGKRGTLLGMTLNRLVDGRIIEAWDNFDMLGLLFQLGVITRPSQGAPPKSAD